MDCQKIWSNPEQKGKEHLHWGGEWKTIEDLEAEIKVPITKPGELGFRIVRLTEGSETIVIAGGGKLYIHHNWIWADRKEDFFHEIVEDNHNNRFLNSSTAHHDKEFDIQAPNMEFANIDKIEEWVKHRRIHATEYKK